MNTAVAALIPAVILVAIATAAQRRNISGASGLDAPWPLEPKKPLTSPEQVLYFRLTEALPAEIVLAQVQLQSFLRFRRGSKAAGIRNRFERLSADFLVCQPDSSIIAAIELDDKSHDAPDRRDADARKAHALKSAGIPLIRWKVHALPNGDEIRRQIAAARAQRFSETTAG